RYYCLDYKAAGLAPDERFVGLGGATRFRAAEAESEAAADGETAPVTADELAARRAAAARAAAAAKEDEERRERRKTLTLNKLGAAACNVRREFVKKLLARKTAPKGAAIFVAKVFATDSYLLTTNNASNVAAELLGLKTEPSAGSFEPPTDAVMKAVAGLPDTGDGRAAVLTLGLVLGALEVRTPKDAWKSAGMSGYARNVGPKEYLQFLADNGYELSAVEEVMTGKRKAEKVYDQHVVEAS